MRNTEMLAIAIVLLSVFIGIYFYPQMPERMASHWNAQGQVDGYMPKFWGLFLMPFLSAILWILFIIIPFIDPLKANIEKFRKYYDGFVLLFLIFMLYLYLLTILWNFGFSFNMPQALAPAFGTLFYYVGILTEHAKRNWFIGIKTPWTLSNEKVWEKTHKLGGKLFKLCGVLAVLGALFQDYAIFFVLAPVLSISAYLFIYSYLEYQKQTKKIDW